MRGFAGSRVGRGKNTGDGEIMAVTKGKLSVLISSKNLKLLDELRFKNNKNWSRSALIEKILREFLAEEEEKARLKDMENEK